MGYAWPSFAEGLNWPNRQQSFIHQGLCSVLLRFRGETDGESFLLVQYPRSLGCECQQTTPRALTSVYLLITSLALMAPPGNNTSGTALGLSHLDGLRSHHGYLIFTTSRKLQREPGFKQVSLCWVLHINIISRPSAAYKNTDLQKKQTEVMVSSKNVK